MNKEIIAGISLGILSYLVYLGYDVTPLLILGAFGYAFYVISRKKGLLRLDSHQKVYQERQFNFDDIGGQETAKQELKEALDFLLKSEQVRKMGIRPLKGILLTGPPGTGKTLLAKAAAGYTDAVFLAASGSEFIEMYAGVGAQRVRNLFQTAREMAKKEKKNRAIIFIDEIEVLGGKRGSHSSHLEYDQTLNQLLVEMDGLTTEKDCQILLIAATNRSDLLDTALLRPGRFDRQVRVDLPDKEDRAAIIRLHCRNKPLAPDVDVEEIASGTYGFSGAHLESLTNEAAILALRDGSQHITQVHLREAVDKVILGEKLGNRASKEILHRVAVHEAGHALVSETLNPGSVDQVTVTSRGSALGYVRHNQAEEQQLYTKSALEKKIMILLAGAISEDLFLGERSTGAANDFQQALSLTEKIVGTGLSRLGVVSPEMIPKSDLYRICQEIIRSLEARTVEIIACRREMLFRIVSLLQEKEKISGNELRGLLNAGNHYTATA
ncbi:MAG: AAA family ATPase [Peptococcaceae bacterium]|nr:AAA family ATPase [Peptococcaceae bacterium]MDH7524111.1 AAA family ATPase [Peptococcaceae bacterium]